MIAIKWSPLPLSLYLPWNSLSHQLQPPAECARKRVQSELVDSEGVFKRRMTIASRIISMYEHLTERVIAGAALLSALASALGLSLGVFALDFLVCGQGIFISLIRLPVDALVLSVKQRGTYLIRGEWHRL